MVGHLQVIVPAARPDHAASATLERADLAHVGAQPQLAAGAFDAARQHRGEAPRTADREAGATVVGAGDDGMLEQRRGRGPRAVVAPACTQHGAQLRAADRLQGLGDALWAWFGTDFAVANDLLADDFQSLPGHPDLTRTRRTG